MAFLEQDQKQFDRLKHLVVGAFFGAVILAVASSIWPGWILESTSRERISVAKHSAVILALGSVCAERVLARPDAATLIAKLKDAKLWERRDVFLKGDDLQLIKLIIVPGDPDPNVQLANHCAELVAPSFGQPGS